MVLAVQNLRVQYGARVLFNDLSFTVEDGERIALAGHNGAGKSTLMKCMAGLNEPDSGSIIKSRHSQVGYLPQEGIHVRGRRLIDEAMSAFADLMDLQERIDALTQEMEKLDPRSAAYSEVLNEIGELELVLHAHDSARLRPRTESILRGLGFKDRDFDRDCGEFSGGWQMRIALAKLLLQIFHDVGCKGEDGCNVGCQRCAMECGRYKYENRIQLLGTNETDDAADHANNCKDQQNIALSVFGKHFGRKCHDDNSDKNGNDRNKRVHISIAEHIAGEVDCGREENAIDDKG